MTDFTERPRPRYSEALKRDTVELYRNTGNSVVQGSKELGVFQLSGSVLLVA